MIPWVGEKNESILQYCIHLHEPALQWNGLPKNHVPTHDTGGKQIYKAYFELHVIMARKNFTCLHLLILTLLHLSLVVFRVMFHKLYPYFNISGTKKLYNIAPKDTGVRVQMFGKFELANDVMQCE